MGRLGAILGAVALATAGIGAEHKSIAGYKIDTPPTIDGIVDTEKEWAKVPSSAGFRDQTTGQKADWDTRYWLAYDDKFIYFAAKMTDPEPKSIKATAYQTNVTMYSDDMIIFEVDLVGRGSDWCAFEMNPKAATKAMFPEGRAAKREWLGEFVAKGRITAGGWEVEAKIPWALMRLPTAGVRTPFVEVIRSVPRSGRWSNWASVLGDGPEMNGTWRDVAIPHIVTSRAIKLLPFGYLGAVDGGSGIFDGGLDLKTSLSDQLDFAASIKPDFRNVENKILSLDYSHAERVAGETRPFFMEGSNFIDPSGEGDQFLSQRIPDFDVGAKVYGKLGEKTSFGVVDVNTIGESNAFAATVSHTLDSASGLRAGVTSLDTPTGRNQTCGGRIYRNWGSVFASAGYIGSNDSAGGSGHVAAANLSYFKGKWQIMGGYREVAASYLPALGIISFVDTKGPSLNVSYDNPIQKGPLQDVWFAASGTEQHHMDGTPFQESFAFASTATWRNTAFVTFRWSADRFEGIGEQTYTAMYGKAAGDANRSWSLGTTWGNQAGTYYFTPTLNVNYRPVQRLQLGLTYQYRDFNGISDQTILTGSYDLGRETALSGRVVEQDQYWNFYMAYSRAGNRGIEYFLIFGDPNALSFRASLIFKITVPFEVKL